MFTHKEADSESFRQTHYYVKRIERKRKFKEDESDRILETQCRKRALGVRKSKNEID